MRVLQFIEFQDIIFLCVGIARIAHQEYPFDK